jgi:hypothetical protein
LQRIGRLDPLIVGRSNVIYEKGENLLISQMANSLNTPE